MKIFEWANRKIKAFTVWDIGILKIFCICVGIILGAYISGFVIQNVVWFLVICVALFIIITFRFLKSK